MSILLAIETSVSQASVALCKDGEVEEFSFESERSQNQLLFAPLKKLLDGLNGRKIDTVLVGTGPGSYSGSRISIAAAHGIAAIHRSQVAGVCSFYAAAQPHDALAIGDARRGSYFYYPIAKAELFPKPALFSKEEFQQELTSYPGQSLFTFETQNPLPVENVSLARPTANGLIQYWESLDHASQDALHKATLEPLYLRSPFITQSKKTHPLLR